MREGSTRESFLLSLTKRLKAGDESAFRMAYDRYGGRVYQLTFRFLKDQAWSEDAVQEVFLKLWLNRRDLKENGNLWLLLFVITKRTCLNKLREVRRKASLFDQLQGRIESCRDLTEEKLIQAEVERITGQAIASLPPRQQHIIRMSRLEGLSHREIAKELGISPNTVKNQIVQALKALKSRIQEAGYSPVLALLWLLKNFTAH